MTRISSRTTRFYKYALPTMWFGTLGLAAINIAQATMHRLQLSQAVFSIGMLLIMAIFGYAIMSWIVFDLVDEVWDCGDSILIRYKGQEYRFTLSEFINFSYAGITSPQRAILSLRKTHEVFDDEIAFMPQLRVFPFSTPPIVRDLMVRIDEARRSSQ